MVEILSKINRENFGTGTAGENAFKIITSCEPCYECGELALETLDYDVLGSLEQTPLCTNCVPKVKNIIEVDLSKTGRTPSFGINGKGRN